MFRGGIGAPEILIILAVVVLLFGGKKLPELARGSGKALRIFKTEVSSLHDDDEKKPEALNTAEADKKPEQG
jgi:sec-independent protein translocase protein TatA